MVFGGNGEDGPGCDNGPRDGFNGTSVLGSAIEMFNSSPTILNCRFEDCSVTGGDGGRGSNGCPVHLEGWGGGWAGRAYGGAVYMGFNSNPKFVDCEFINCFAQGGNGGNGGDGTPNAGTYDGRGGSWMYPDYR